MARSFFQRTGYDVFITIGGAAIARSWITGMIRITKSENQATVANFTLLHNPGLQNPEWYQGQIVNIDIRTPSGLFRVFTGIIDTPELDLINQVTTYLCTDNRENKLKALPQSFISSIGYYSEAVFGTPSDKVDELEKRLSTVPMSVDFDNYGYAIATAWAPKTSADFTLQPNQVYYQEPKVTFSPRIKSTNSVSITFNYTYPRLHQQVLYYAWGGVGLCNWYETRFSLPTKDMVEGAAKGSSWTVLGLHLGDIWPAGSYNCPGKGLYTWEPDKYQYEYKPRTDADGGVKTDAHGNPLLDISRVSKQDNSSHLCSGATWWLRLRFGQNVIETYTLQVNAPQSISKYGYVEKQERADLTANYEVGDWEKSQTDYQSRVNLFFNKDINRAELNAGVNVALHKARTLLIASHRDVTVQFRTPIWPQIGLQHTVSVNTYPLKCRGKVSRVEHEINVATTEAKTFVQLSLTKSTGSAGDSVLKIPPLPFEDTSYIGLDEFKVVTMGTHIGVSPNAAGYENMQGYFANGTLPSLDPRQPSHRTDYPEGFIMDTPPMADQIRNNRTIGVSATYSVSIPNDFLEVRY